MPNLFAPVGLATPEQQSEKAGALSRAYRTIMRKLSSDVGPALDFPGNPLGPAMKVLPFIGLGLKGVSGAAKAARGGIVGQWKDVLSTALRKRDYVAGLRESISKTFGQGRKGLPKLRSSEEAMTFGADWAGDQRMADLLKAAREETDVEWKRLYNAGQKQKALEVGQEGALYTEALDTIEGKMKPSFLKDFGYEGYTQKPTGEVALGTELKEMFGAAQEDIRRGMIEAFSRK